MNKQRVLFLYAHNSARSQMAEGFSAPWPETSSRSPAPAPKPRAFTRSRQAMADAGIHLSAPTAKIVDRFMEQPWDYVITVCDAANEACPVFPKTSNRLHWSFEDPSQARGGDDRRLEVFRQVRDQIKRRVIDWVRRQQQGAPG